MTANAPQCILLYFCILIPYDINIEVLLSNNAVLYNQFIKFKVVNMAKCRNRNNRTSEHQNRSQVRNDIPAKVKLRMAHILEHHYCGTLALKFMRNINHLWRTKITLIRSGKKRMLILNAHREKKHKQKE